MDDELKLGRLLDRKISGSRAFENLARVNANLAMGIQDIRIVAHETTGDGVVAKLVDRRDRCSSHQRNKLVAMHIENRIAANQQRVGPFLSEAYKCAFDPLFVGGVQNAEFEAKRLRRGVHGG